jgi:hypothetical protein
MVVATFRNRALCDAVASIYDAALDWRAWPVALDRLADLFGASTAQLGSYDAATHRLEMVMPRSERCQPAAGHFPRWRGETVIVEEARR